MKRIIFAVFLLSLYNFGFSQTETKPKITREESRTMVLRENDNGQDYIITFENNEVAKVSLNGKEIPKNDFNKHQNVIDKMLKNLPKEFSDAMQVNSEDEKIGGYKPIKGQEESEQTIKVSKLENGNSKIVFKTSEGKEFEFLIKGADEITMNGEPMSEGEIVIKTVEKIIENSEEPVKDDNVRKKIIIKEKN